MALIIDIAIVAIIALFTILGKKRGLVKLAFKLCTFFIAIIIAFLVYKPVAHLVMEKTTIDETIENAITQRILPEGASSEDELTEPTNLPSIIVKNSSNTVKSIANSFATTIIETACLLLVFILAKIILKFVTFLADAIAKLPILKQFNELGGLIYGILEGLLIVFVIFAIITFISPVIDHSFIDAINSSLLGSLFFNNNILLKFIV